MARSVYDFHQRFDVPRVGQPTAEEAPSADGLAALRSRLAFLIEETGEHARELNRGELGDASKEIADVAFVAMGTLLVLDGMGVDACRAVAGKNNAKTAETHAVDATSGKLVRRVSAS
jgi:NTP pyrophosphatase (non-canonical NTP hydrolase)